MSHRGVTKNHGQGVNNVVVSDAAYRALCRLRDLTGKTLKSLNEMAVRAMLERISADLARQAEQVALQDLAPQPKVTDPHHARQRPPTAT